MTIQGKVIPLQSLAMQAFEYQKIVIAVTKCPICVLGGNLFIAAATNWQSDPRRRTNGQDRKQSS
jgi:hypothetical protein